MSDAVVKMYYRLVTSGRRGIEDVPEQYRDEIQTMVDELNPQSEE
jgi:hypothetical protein